MIDDRVHGGRGEARGSVAKGLRSGRLIRLDGPRQKRYLSAASRRRRRGTWRAFGRSLAGALCPMDSFEWNKIAGAVLFALLVSFGLSIFSEITLRNRSAGIARLRHRRGREPAAGGGGAAAAASQPIAVLLASADAGRRRGERQEMRRLPHLRRGRGQQDRPEPLRRREPPDRRRMRATNTTSAMHEFAEQAQDLDLRAPEHLPARPEGHRARHQDGLRRA